MTPNNYDGHFVTFVPFVQLRSGDALPLVGMTMEVR